MSEQYPMTCVSGYWKVGNKHGNKYMDWFKNSLKIRCPYVFFTDLNSIELIKKYRPKDVPTHYIILKIKDFFTYKYKDKFATNPAHCPSVELNLIWNEKIFLIKKAYELNPFSSDYFCWIDAGICTYRNNLPPQVPFPNLDKLRSLPTDKFIYSSSSEYIEADVRLDNYYHHISGTSYILHKGIINNFTNMYNEYLERLFDKNNIWTDQVLLTHIYKDHKDLFYKLCDGYGVIIPYMF